MKLYFNLDTGAVTQLITVTSSLNAALPLKSGQNEPVSIQFHNSGTPALLPDSTLILLGIKVAGKFEGDYLTSCSTFTAPGDASGFYTGILPTNTAAINAALNDDGTQGNDLASIDGTMAEIQYTLPTALLPSKSQTFLVDIANRVNMGGEGVPEAADPPYPPQEQIIRFLPGITGYTGGGTNFDSLATVDLTIPTVVAFNHPTDGLLFYDLTAGTDATTSPSTIRPVDYNASTNARVWKLRTNVANTLLTTSGAPSNSVGKNGDYAIDNTAQLIYGPKASGTWPAGATFKGTTGSAGPGVPTGGAVGLPLVKQSTTDFDTAFAALGVVGGGTGQTTFTNGQLLIGNTTGNTLAKATLTAGTNIAITNGAGSISIAFTGTLPVANGGTGAATFTDGQILIGNSTGSTLTPATLTAGTGISITNGHGTITIAAVPSPWLSKTANYTAVAGDKILADTSGGSWTLKAPASPALGAEFLATDPNNNWASHNLTIDGNGKNIEGSSTLTCDVVNGGARLIYNGTQWIVRNF